MTAAAIDRLEFAAVLARELPEYSPYKVATLAAALMRDAKTLHRLAEDACNTGGEEIDAQTDRIKLRVQLRLKETGIRPLFSGDPRGAVLKLELQRTKLTNGWGGEGFCVP